MNSFSQFISNTLKVSLLCGISLTAAEKTMAKWETKVNETEPTAEGIRILQRTCTKKLFNGHLKDKKKWSKRRDNAEQIKNNISDYSRETAKILLLSRESALPASRPVPALVPDTPPTPLSVQGRTPTTALVKGRNFQKPLDGDKPGQAKPLTFPSAPGRIPTTPSVKPLNGDKPSNGKLSYNRPLLDNNLKDTEQFKPHPRDDHSRVGLIKNSLEKNPGFGLNNTPKKPTATPRNERPSNAPKTNVRDQIEALNYLLTPGISNSRECSTYKALLNKLLQAQELGIIDYTDESELNRLLPPIPEGEDYVATETTTTTTSVTRAPGREDPASSRMMSVDNEIENITRYIEGPHFRKQETRLVELLAKLRRAKEKGISAYRDIEHLETLLAAVSNRSAGRTTTTTTTVANKNEAPSEVWVSVDEQIKVIEAQQRGHTPLDTDTLVLLDELKQAKGLGISSFTSLEDLESQMVAIGLSEDNLPEKAANIPTPAPAVRSNDGKALQRIADLELQLAFLIDAKVRDSELRPLRAKLRKLQGE